MDLDGNGWVQCACGERHWGKHGAAGLFLTVDDEVLLQLRPDWAHQGGSWAIPGGARDSHESVVAAALREAHEETALDPDLVEIRGVHRLQHPDWRYDTVLARCARKPTLSEHEESVELRWVPMAQLAQMRLHPGFARALPDLQITPVSLVVDSANVVGSRPDGWWHDRVGATARLIDQLESVAGRVMDLNGAPVLLQNVDLVVEGAARRVPDPPLDSLVNVIRADSSGDDTIAELADTLTDVLVVTSDRGLQSRVPRFVGAGELNRWLGR